MSNTVFRNCKQQFEQEKSKIARLRPSAHRLDHKRRRLQMRFCSLMPQSDLHTDRFGRKSGC